MTFAEIVVFKSLPKVTFYSIQYEKEVKSETEKFFIRFKKIKKMALHIFDRILNAIPQNEERESNISFRIAQRIDFLMRQKQLSKSDLARGMSKEPAQISRWMSGNHNFTIKTMVELEVYFGEPILISPTANEEIAEYTQYVKNQNKVPAFAG